MKTEFIAFRDFEVTGAAYNGGFVDFNLSGINVIELPIGTSFSYTVEDGSPIGMANHGTGKVTGMNGILISTDVIATINVGAIITGTLTVTTSLDLIEDVVFPLSYSIEDIFELDKRKTPVSKTIQIPFTHNNNLFFNHIYKINTSGNYDSRKKTRCRVKNSGLLVFTGVLKIDDIGKMWDGPGSYNVQLSGNLFDIKELLGDKTIRDLDFSRYDHVLDVETIWKSWAGVNPGPGGLVNGIPLVTDFTPTPSLGTQTIDYGATTGGGPAITSTTVDGVGRVTIDLGMANTFAVGDEVFIWSDINLISGTQTIVGKITNKIVLAMAYANLTTSVTASSIEVQKRTWLAIGYFYPCVDYGRYQKYQTSGQLEIGKDYRIITIEPGDDFTNLQDVGLNPGLAPSNAVGTVFTASNGIGNVSDLVYPASWISGSILLGSELKSDGGELGAKDDSINKWRLTDFIPHIHVREVWQKMFELIGIECTWSFIDTNLFRRLIMPMDQKFDREDDGGVNIDSIVYMNDWLPGMKLKDFFISICNMFNNFILPKGQTGIELINRGDYFTTNTVRRERDLNVPLNIKLCNVLLPKYYQLKYKDGTDFFNEDYNRDVGDIANTGGYANEINRKYGDYFASTGNEFSDEHKKIELSFMPTVLAGPVVGVGSPVQPPIYGDSDRTISACYSADENGDNASRDESFRILIAGIRGTDYPWSLRTQQSFASRTTVIDYKYGANIWPYAGHIDNVFNAVPIWDLNFDIPIAQYFPYVYNPTNWANVCLEKLYWRKYLKDLLSLDGKQITATIKLSASEIAQLDFSDINVLDEFQCKLLKVIDWDANGDGLCKCEFLLKT